MGEPSRKTAARDDILRDFGQTNLNAIARGGVAADLAAQRIAPIVMIINSLSAQMKAAELVAAPLVALLAAADRHADKTIGKVSDDIWNDVGRPASGRGGRASRRVSEGSARPAALRGVAGRFSVRGRWLRAMEAGRGVRDRRL